MKTLMRFLMRFLIRVLRRNLMRFLRRILIRVLIRNLMRILTGILACWGSRRKAGNNQQTSELVFLPASLVGSLRRTLLIRIRIMILIGDEQGSQGGSSAHHFRDQQVILYLPLYEDLNKDPYKDPDPEKGSE